jgi:hypothetical protein
MLSPYPYRSRRGPVRGWRLSSLVLLLTFAALLPVAAPAAIGNGKGLAALPTTTVGPDPPRVPGLWMPVTGAVVRGFDARAGAVRARAPGDRHLRSGGGDRAGAGRREDRVRRSGGRDHLGQPRGRPGRPGDPGPDARPGHGGPGLLTGTPGPGRPPASGRPRGGRRADGGRRVGVGGDPAPERAGRRGLCRSPRVPDRPAETAAGSVADPWRPSGPLTGWVADRVGR